MYKVKSELNQLIKKNTHDEILRMVPFVKHKYSEYPLYEITVR